MGFVFGICNVCCFFLFPTLDCTSFPNIAWMNRNIVIWNFLKGVPVECVDTINPESYYLKTRDGKLESSLEPKTCSYKMLNYNMRSKQKHFISKTDSVLQLNKHVKMDFFKIQFWFRTFYFWVHRNSINKLALFQTKNFLRPSIYL